MERTLMRRFPAHYPRRQVLSAATRCRLGLQLKAYKAAQAARVERLGGRNNALLTLANASPTHFIFQPLERHELPRSRVKSSQVESPRESDQPIHRLA